MRKTEWRGQSCPPQYEIISNGGMKQLLLYVDAHEVQSTLADDASTAQQETEWEATKIAMPIGELNYGAIVSALVTALYPSDVMQAIVNNHLLDPTDEEHEREFREMQEYRKFAKVTARGILEGMNEKGGAENGEK